MSKHRSKSREDNNTSNNNNFMGLNPQMLQMLGINPNEVERISNIMNSMNRDGFDINSLGNLLNQNSNPQVGQNDFSNVTNNMNNNSNENNAPNYNSQTFNNTNNTTDNFTSSNGFNNSYQNQDVEYDDIDVEIIEPELDGDPNLSMLKAVRSLVNDDRKRFLKRVIEMYKNGEIIY